MNALRIGWLTCWIFLLAGLSAAPTVWSQNFDEIPSPRPTGWVVDLTGAVPDFAAKQLNELCEEIHTFRNAEMAVVVISSTHNRNHRQYATDLFNHWGIGDAFANNGLLLFVAFDDRKAELILGDGIDNIQTRATAQQIMDDFIIPRFKKNDVAGALYGGAFGSARDILGINDLTTKIPQGALLRATPQQQGGRVRKNQGGRRSPSFWIWMTGGLLGLGGISLVSSRYYVRYRPRTCPDCSHSMTMLGESQDDVLLEDGERVEERIGSVDYDVWACMYCDRVLKFRYGVFFTRYSKCPECAFKTKSKVERTLVEATESHGGKVRVDEHCAHCSFHDSFTYRTPRIEVTSSSSGSFSSSGGFSGGGSGFGGGSSSGGGASGGW